MNDKPFRILGLQQVAIGGTDKRRLHHLWVDLLGLSVHGESQSVSENVDETLLTLGHGSAKVDVDLMQPLNLNAKPRVDTPALNHIGLWVDDLPAAVKWLSERGMRFAPGGIRPGASGHDICFIHPKPSADLPLSGEGVLIELVQAPGTLIAALARSSERSSGSTD